MDVTSNRKSIWESGSRGGLVLGLATSAFMILSQLCSTHLSGFPATLAAIVIWCAKFAGCIYLMYFFMKKFADSNPDATKQEVFKSGAVTALCSAFIFAAIYLVFITYVEPETFQNAIDTAMQTYAGMLDSNSEARLEGMADKMPAITFFLNLIYCTLFGCVVAAIFSGKLRSNNPFNDTNANIQ